MKRSKIFLDSSKCTRFPPPWCWLARSGARRRMCRGGAAARAQRALAFAAGGGGPPRVARGAAPRLIERSPHRHRHRRATPSHPLPSVLRRAGPTRRHDVHPSVAGAGDRSGDPPLLRWGGVQFPLAAAALGAPRRFVQSETRRRRGVRMRFELLAFPERRGGRARGGGARWERAWLQPKRRSNGAGAIFNAQ